MDTDNGKPPIDLDKPIENPRLKELRARLESATDEEEQRKLQGELFQEIAENAWFLVIAEWSKPPEANEDGKAFVAAGTTISLHMRGTDDGKRYFEAFTDWEEIGRKHPTDGTTRTLVMGFDDLAGLVLKDGSAAAGFVINPDGDPFLVDRELVGFLRERKRLAAGEIVEEIQKEAERVEVAPLLGMPPPLERALRECVAKDRRIRALWTFLMRCPSQGEESPEELLFVFDAPPDCRREIVESIAAATKPHLDGRMVNLVSSDDGLGKDLSHETPFYRRKFLGLF